MTTTTQYLTLKEIAPRWYKQLETKHKKPIIDAKLNIRDPKFCIAGEAHKFTDLYFFNIDHRCTTCVDFALDITNVIDHDKNSILPDKEKTYEKLKKGFEKHWNNKHANRKEPKLR